MSSTPSRPDGRVESPELSDLRTTTRALRFHLDTLPVGYNLNCPPDQFLAGLAFMLARQRFACADSMLGAGFGGSVVGTLARSLFSEGLRWLWIGEDPTRRRRILGDLIEERNRICLTFEQTDVSSDSLTRWLMPIPNVADLAGHSHTWANVEALPTETELLHDFLTHQRGTGGDDRVRALLDMEGLQGAVKILEYAGHGNYLGLMSSLTLDGAIAHDLRADHEALFMQVAAAGVVITLAGSATAVPELWPAEMDKDTFIDKAVALAERVCDTAAKIHGLRRVRKTAAQVSKKPRDNRAPRGLLRPMAAVIPQDELLPDVNTVEHVAAAAEAYWEVAGSLVVNPWKDGRTSLNITLMYAGGWSLLETVMVNYTQPGAAPTAVSAARMLLEEAARATWRYSVAPDKAEARFVQYFDEYRAMRRNAINTLTGSGISTKAAEQIFALPPNVQLTKPLNQMAKGRQPLPTITSMLRDLGKPYPEPGWLELAYTLLSQMTHSTPVAYLHTMRAGDPWTNDLSPEMLALALDVACLSSARLIGLGAWLLSDLNAEADNYRKQLAKAAANVHNAARSVHFLD
ncbi:hypothetical protein EV650_0957 [Kribbella kalugense]|uniref:Uncharacterized protein n=2 Tax=Kribbella kalugense TaxID=2512221 RepID=A0A4V3G898_9ACTN|nr:hypothetical protein EV650_0957 [Kribbella kalugense]